VVYFSQELPTAYYYTGPHLSSKLNYTIQPPLNRINQNLVTKPEHRTEGHQFKDFLYKKYFISRSLTIGVLPILSKIYYFHGNLEAKRRLFTSESTDGQIPPINFKSEKIVSFSDKETNMAVALDVHLLKTTKFIFWLKDALLARRES